MQRSGAEIHHCHYRHAFAVETELGNRIKPLGILELPTAIAVKDCACHKRICCQKHDCAGEVFRSAHASN